MTIFFLYIISDGLLCVFAADKTPSGFPVITVQRPTTRVIEIGHTAVMQCKASGNPIPRLYWLKDSKRVDMTNPRYSMSDGEYLLSIYYPSLALSWVFFLWYCCCCSNSSDFSLHITFEFAVHLSTKSSSSAYI